MQASPNPPKVFISYSHDSKSHSNRVLELANRLRGDGVDCNIDQYESFPPDGWPRWMENQLEWADFVLVVCTPTYRQRFRGQAQPGEGLGVSWEGAIVTHELYNAATKNTRFIPILYSAATQDSIPSILQGSTRYRVDNQEDYESLYRLLTNQPSIEKPLLGKLMELAARDLTLPPLPPREQKQHFQPLRSDFFAYDEAWVGRNVLIQDVAPNLIWNNISLEFSDDQTCLPCAMSNNLSFLPDNQVLIIAESDMSSVENARLSELLDKQQEGSLTKLEETELQSLMKIYKDYLLQKAKALNEAVQRGLMEPLES